jgi:hypothetical protein
MCACKLWHLACDREYHGLASCCTEFKELTWNGLFLFLFGLAFLGAPQGKKLWQMAGFWLSFCCFGNQPLHLRFTR